MDKSLIQYHHNKTSTNNELKRYKNSHSFPFCQIVRVSAHFSVRICMFNLSCACVGVGVVFVVSYWISSIFKILNFLWWMNNRCTRTVWRHDNNANSICSKPSYCGILIWIHKIHHKICGKKDCIEFAINCENL